MLKNTTLKLDEMVVHDAPPPAPTTPQPSEPAVAPEPTSFKLNFDFNAAVVRTTDHEVLAKVKSAMDADGSLICNISGHTDAAGSASYNMGLSRKRANAVKTYLVSIGMKGSRIKTEYFGSTKLILVTDDRDEAEVNRRVEIDLIKK